MIELTLPNLAVYSAQVLVIVAIAAAADHLAGNGLPRMRLIFWRAVLAVCLALPIAAAGAPVASAIVSTEIVSSVAEPIAAIESARYSIERVIFFAIAIGIALRAAWLGVGLLRLRRLRTESQPLTLD